MGFDPDAYLQKRNASGQGGGFDPDLYLRKRSEGVPDPGPTQQPAAEASAKREVSKLESFGRGAAQGATLGFADEIAGAFRTITDPYAARSRGTYAAARDSVRKADAEAKAANPGTYLAGEVGGGLATSFVPGVGIAKGAGLGAMALKGGITGAAAGLGYSEADTTGGLVRDTLVGGAGGAALTTAFGALGRKVVGGARGRDDMRTIRTLTTGAKPTTKQVIGSKASEVADGLRAEGLGPKQLKDADKALGLLQSRKAEAGREIGSALKTLDKAALGPQKAEVQGALQRLLQQYEGNPGEEGKRKALQKLIKQIDKDWGDSRRVTFSQVHDFKKSLQAGAYAGSKALPENKQARFGKEIAGSVNDILRTRISEVAEQGRSVANTRLPLRSTPFSELADAGRIAEQFPTLNKRFGLLEQATKATQERANKAVLDNVAPVSPFNIKQAAMKLVPGKAVARGADRGLAALQRAAEAGNTPAQLVEQALRMGIPEATARAFAANLAAQRKQ